MDGLEGVKYQMDDLVIYSTSQANHYENLRVALHRIADQSINQSNFYSANIPGVARLGGATARSVFKYEVIEAIP